MFTTEPQPPPFDPHLGPTASTRPGTVIAASVLMWLHFPLACCFPAAFAMVLALRLTDVESGPIDSSEISSFGLFASVYLLCGAVFLTLVGILAVKLLRGRRWARITTLALSGLAIVVPMIAAALILGSVTPSSAVAIAHEGAIAVCLCTPSARRWFNGSGRPADR